MERRDTNWFVLSGPAEYGVRLLGASLSREGFIVVQDGQVIQEARNAEGRNRLNLSVPYKAGLKLLNEQVVRENGHIFEHRSPIMFQAGMGDHFARIATATSKELVDEEGQQFLDGYRHALSTRYKAVFLLAEPIRDLQLPAGMGLGPAGTFLAKLREAYKDTLEYDPIEVKGEDVVTLEKAAKFVKDKMNTYLRISP